MATILPIQSTFDKDIPENYGNAEYRQERGLLIAINDIISQSGLEELIIRYFLDVAYANKYIFVFGIGKSAIHIVSAWACENKMVFGQVATDEKRNEITAIPKLLEMLVLDGSVVTIDAMGCQKRIAEKIIDSNGDYIFSLKGNHGTLHEEVKLFMDDAIANSGSYDYSCDTDGGHGRVEIRNVWYSENVRWIQDLKQWPGLSSLVAVESQGIIDDKVSTERRYFISSLSGVDAETIGRMIHSHWGIENKLHWSQGDTPLSNIRIGYHNS